MVVTDFYNDLGFFSENTIVSRGSLLLPDLVCAVNYRIRLITRIERNFENLIIISSWL